MSTTKTEPQTKGCGRCKRYLPTERFSRDRSTSDGLQAYCKECRAAMERKHWEEHPETKRSYNKAKTRALWQLKKRHPEEFDDLFTIECLRIRGGDE